MAALPPTLFRVATWNIGSLRSKGAELVETLTRRRVDLCGLQETRWRGGTMGNQARWLSGKDSRMKLFWCGNARGLGGVGVLLAEKWADKVFKIERVSDSLLVLKLIIGRQIFTFISLYVPQKGTAVSIRDAFYDDLESTLMAIPPSERLFLLGDWNGHVGASPHGFEGVHGGHGFGLPNPEGDRVLELALAHNLLVGNTLFIKRDSHLVTFSSGGNLTQVDYILFRKNFRRSVKDVKVICSEEVVRQHKLLVCDFKVCLSPPPKRKFVPRLRTWKLRKSETSSSFSLAFRFRAEDTASNDVESAWVKLKKPLLEAAEKVCGFSSSHSWRKQTWWWNDQVGAAIKEKRARFKAYINLRKRKCGNHPKECDYPEDVRRAKEEYLTARRHAKHEVWLAKSEASEVAFEAVDPQGSNIFRIAKQMERENQDVVGETCVFNDAGELALTDEQKLSAWVQHYSKLLNIEFDWPRDALPPVSPTEGPPPPITLDMVEEAISSMKLGKAAGPSGIIAEMLKLAGRRGTELVRDLGELVFSTGTVPAEWGESIILNLYKGKGDALSRGNYRGLKLTDQVMKVLERVLDSIIRQMVDIGKIQFGFVPGRGTTDAIFHVRQLQEKYRAVNKPLYFCFVDLEKAFDRVPRDVLWWALRSLRVEEWAVRAIQGMYHNARSRVRVNGQLSEEFKVQVGVHQGSVLSPLLFIIVLEALSRNISSDTTVAELLYADDLVIVADSQEECVARLIDWKAGLADRGLRVNMGKTKFMVSGTGLDVPKDTGRYPCAVCRQGVGAHSIFCGSCKHWVHKRCSGKSGTLQEDPNFVCLGTSGKAPRAVPG